MLIRIIYNLTDELSGNSMVLKLRIYRKIYNMQPVILVKLIRPARIEVISSYNKILQGFIDGSSFKRYPSVLSSARASDK